MIPSLSDHCWLYYNWISMSGLLVSILTLSLGIVAYQKLLVNKLSEKQLEVVLDFILSIEKCKNFYTESSIHVGAMQDVLKINIFQFSKEDIADNVPIYFQDPTEDHKNLNWDFYYNFYNNPLLPRPISQALQKFSFDENDSHTIGEIHQWHTKMIYLTNTSIGSVLSAPVKLKNIPVKDRAIPNYINFGEFKDNCNQLKIAINKWLNSNGIKEVNMLSG